MSCSTAPAWEETPPARHHPRGEGPSATRSRAWRVPTPGAFPLTEDRPPLSLPSQRDCAHAVDEALLSPWGVSHASRRFRPWNLHGFVLVFMTPQQGREEEIARAGRFVGAGTVCRCTGRGMKLGLGPDGRGEQEAALLRRARGWVRLGKLYEAQ